mgnify:FL=1
MRLLLILLTFGLLAPGVASADDKEEQKTAPEAAKEQQDDSTIITTEYGVFRLTFVDERTPALVPLPPPPTLLWSPQAHNDTEDNNFFHPFVLIEQKKNKKTL